MSETVDCPHCGQAFTFATKNIAWVTFQPEKIVGKMWCKACGAAVRLAFDLVDVSLESEPKKRTLEGTFAPYLGRGHRNFAGMKQSGKGAHANKPDSGSVA